VETETFLGGAPSESDARSEAFCTFNRHYDDDTGGGGVAVSNVGSLTGNLACTNILPVACAAPVAIPVRAP